jgi:AcrR family transcriptional regulator
MAANTATEARAPRLDKPAWIAAAIDQLAETGIDGLRVEVLAKRLGVTKGSFYWHFKDRDALLESLLDTWRRQATFAIIDRIERFQDGAKQRLLRLIRRPFDRQRSKRGEEIELAIRLWGRQDTRAIAALREVDQLRLRYISSLYQEMGHSAESAEIRAAVAYSYMRVGPSLMDQDVAALPDSAASLLAEI